MTVLDYAALPKWHDIPYALPPDPNGRASVDCSLYVLMVFRDAGRPFPGPVRTAENIRQVCTPVGDDDVQPGDLIFFQNTYSIPGASHVGISLGEGSGRMWDAHQRSTNPGQAVGISELNDYWQSHWMEVRRYGLVAPVPPIQAPATGQIWMRVDAWGLNVRERPSATSPILTTLDHGAGVQAGPYAWRPVTVTGPDGKPISGWSADEYLEKA